MKIKSSEQPKKSKPVVRLKDLKPKKNPKGAAIGRIEPRFPPP
jgi:hypothetical protein